jgi:plastocyanin
MNGSARNPISSRTRLVLAVALVAGAGCSSEDPAVANDSNVVNVRVSSNRFDPPTVKIKVGQTVRWTWAGGTHNVVSGASCTPDDKFRSGPPMAGGSFDKPFDTPGTYPYYCEPHCSMGMTGEVIVE